MGLGVNTFKSDDELCSHIDEDWITFKGVRCRKCKRPENTECPVQAYIPSMSAENFVETREASRLLIDILSS